MVETGRMDSAARPRMKILLVDDSKDNLFSIQTALEPLGEELMLANSGKEALRLCLDNDFAAILLDVRMPDMDGFETAEMIRSRNRSAVPASNTPGDMTYPPAGGHRSEDPGHVPERSPPISQMRVPVRR